jgi:site-specific DNA recombinase
MLRNEIYVGMRIWNRTQFVKVPGTNKRIARWRPHDQLQKQPAPELRVVSDALWVKVQERQGLLKEKYADSGRKPVNRGAGSPYLLSGFLTCGTCGANLIITSGGKGHLKRYGCPQHWNRHACANKFTIRQEDLEADFFSKLQDEVLTQDAIKLTADIIMKEQKRKASKSDHEKKIQQLKNEQANLVAAIAKIGHSDSLISALHGNEAELRKLSVVASDSHQLTHAQILASVKENFRSLPTLLKEAPECAKTKLVGYIDKIKMIPQTDGTYVAEGKWDILGGWGPVMVAGAGFEPATFGL